MQVRLSNFLQAMLETAAANPAEFGLEAVHQADRDFFTPKILAERFREWKETGCEDYYFGKDVPNYRPVGELGEEILRHVHIAPLTNPEELRAWDWKWEKEKRRTSDTSLMYVNGGRYGFLLLTILWEPDGHEVIKMKNEGDRKFMNLLGEVAKQFIDTGTFDF